jgi:hypothetical protein
MQMATVRKSGAIRGHFEHLMWNFCPKHGGEANKVNTVLDDFRKETRAVTWK